MNTPLTCPYCGEDIHNDNHPRTMPKIVNKTIEDGFFIEESRRCNNVQTALVGPVRRHYEAPAITGRGTLMSKPVKMAAHGAYGLIREPVERIAALVLDQTEVAAHMQAANRRGQYQL